MGLNVLNGAHMSIITFIIWLIALVVLTPLIGGLISGADRILTARMQSRVGPPLFQPFYDVAKLYVKQKLVVNRFHNDFVLSGLIFTIASVGLFFAGQDLLLTIFVLILGNVFVVIAAYVSNSPYSLIGAERELLQMLAAEPMILIAAVGLYMVTGTFNIAQINADPHCAFLYLPGVFLGLTYILTIKLRKSPFDLSTSHHAHQELVKGLSTEFAGPSLAWFEIIHWYETIFCLALIYLFFANIPWLGILVLIAVYFAEIVIDNVNARIKWELMLGSAWIVTLILGVGNLLVLNIVK
jgi:formate hydrogenlyase subunit 4